MAGPPNPKDESRIADAGESGGRAASGLAVDRSGGPTIDPTKNVLDLVRAESKYQDFAREAEVRRQDDLRKAESQLQHMINDNQIRLNLAETRRLDDLANLRQQYDVRVADSLALQVKTTSDLISTQLDKVTNSLSQQIRDGNESFSIQLKNISDGLGARIYDLEKSRWEVGGRASVADPATASALAEMAKAIAGLTLTGGKTEGSKTGQASIVAYIAMAAAFAVGVLTIVDKLN